MTTPAPSTRGRTVTLGAAMVGLAAAALAHDMFLVVPDHDLPAHAAVTVALYNGTFGDSENTIDRDRMADVSVVDGTGAVSHPAPARWRDEGETSLLELTTGAPGTYLVGVSTRPRVIELSAEDFNEYLEHDGVLDVLEARRRDGTLDRPARERYSKHVKTLLRVGGQSSASWSHRLGYPLEIVPRADPAALAPGDVLEIELLAAGEPVAGQLVYASYDGHAPAPTGAREALQSRTDDTGVARLELTAPGRWYVRLIRMVPVAAEDVDYESTWATLTFEVR